MRTVKVTYDTKLDATSSLRVETEAIVDEDVDAAEAGAEAWKFILAFVGGMSTEADE